MFNFSGFGNINLETVIAAVALVSTAVAWLVDRYILRRKRLVYRVQVDAQIGVYPGADKTQRMVDVEVRHQGVVVPDPSIVLLRLDNAGGMDIDPHDMHEKVSFAFPDRVVPDTSKVAGGSYKFWEVEHAYTFKSPQPGTLTAASTQARPVLERGGLVPCSDLPAGFCG